MDYIYENDSTITPDLFWEAFKTFLKKNIVLDIIVYIVFIIISSMYLSQTSIVFTVAVVVIIGLFAFLFEYKKFRKECKKTYSQMLEVANESDVLNRNIRFYNDYFEILCPNGDSEIIQYNDLKKYCITKNMYILTENSKASYFMRKDSFIKGSLEDVHNLIWKK